MKAVCIISQNIHEVKSGGGQCSLRNLEAIQSVLGKENLYTCIISPDYDEIKYRHNELCIPGLKNNLESAIAAVYGDKCCKHCFYKIIWEFIEGINPDIVYIDTSKLGGLAKKIKLQYEKKTICFFHNVEADYSLNLVKNRGWQYFLSYWASVRNERQAVKYADTIICLNPREANRIKELYGRTVEAIIPITFKDTFSEKKVKIDKTKGVLFVGSYFPPNYDGVKWFIDSVMKQLPDVTLTIVGKGFECKKDELQRDNVVVIGTVENLEDFYYTYPIVVMPILYGAGMKVKTAEAMMYGKVIVATDEALEGYEVENIEGIFRCNTTEEFIIVIKKFFENENVESKSRELFRNKYEFSVAEKQYDAIFMENKNDNK